MAICTVRELNQKAIEMRVVDKLFSGIWLSRRMVWEREGERRDRESGVGKRMMIGGNGGIWMELTGFARLLF